jgi:hypothetical protein
MPAMLGMVSITRGAAPAQSGQGCGIAYSAIGRSIVNGPHDSQP